MKKLVSYLCTALLTVCGTFGLAACSDAQTGGYAEYESVAGKTEDIAFEFAGDGLPDELSVYPVGTGRTYYVSASSGNDSNDGLSEDSPLRTVNAVNALDLQPGDTVRFRGGETFTGTLRFSGLAGTEEQPITFCGYDDEAAKPHLVGQSYAVNFSSASNIVLRDLELEASGQDYSDGRVDGNVVRFSYGAGTAQYGNIYIVNNLVYSNSVQNMLFGISITLEADLESQLPERVVSDVLIYGNEVHTVGRSGIQTGGWFGKETGNQNACRTSDFYNITIENNTVYDVGHIGIYLTAVTDSAITRNVVYDTGMAEHGETLEGDCGIMVLSADGCDVTYNVTYNNYDAGVNYDAMGIDIDWNTNNVNVQYNHTYDCEGAGIATMANQNSFIRNNRVENNQCQTSTMHAQINVGNFTSSSEYIDDSYHSVNNLLIENNLIIGEATTNTYLFKTQVENGTSEWQGNVFKGNHLVNTAQTDGSYWIYVEDGAPWYSFAGNRYYTQDTSFKFNVYDYTSAVLIDPASQAFLYDGTFDAWTKRDVGAQLFESKGSAPSQLSGVAASYEDGKVSLSWESSEGDIWHYNVHLTEFDEDIAYTNLLGETEEPSFLFAPEAKGEYYIVIVPESGEGVYGAAQKVKITIV